MKVHVFSKLSPVCLAMAMATMTPLCAVAPNTVIKTLQAGINPAKLAITPDGRYVYVANSNSPANDNNVTVM